MAAGLLYGGMPADFVVGQGAEAEILDENGAPLDPQRFGAAALLPLTSDTFQMYDGPGGTQITDLYTYPAQDPITEVTSNTDYAERATLPLFFAPDTHEGDLYASADGVVFYRLVPATDTLFARLGVLEGLEDTRVTSDLADWSDTAPTDGQIPVWDNGTGEWTPGAAAGTGTVTQVAGENPDGSGNVVAAALLTALGLTSAAADIATVKSRGYMLCAPSGGSYQAKPAGFPHGIFPGTVEPVSGLGDFDLWIRPVEESP